MPMQLICKDGWKVWWQRIIMSAQFHLKYNSITLYFQRFQQLSNIVIICPKKNYKKNWIQVITTTTSIYVCVCVCVMTIYCYIHRQQQIITFLGSWTSGYTNICDFAWRCYAFQFILYHISFLHWKHPNVNKPFGNEGILYVLELLVMKLWIRMSWNSSTRITTKTMGASAINAYIATKSTICGVGEKIDTFPKTTIRCAERAYVTTCSTIVHICLKVTTTSLLRSHWTTSLRSIASKICTWVIK